MIRRRVEPLGLGKIYRLFHAAGNNQSTDTKFSVVFTYHASDNRPLPGTRSAALPGITLT